MCISYSRNLKMNNCKEFRYLEISFVSNYFICRNIINKRTNENLFARFKEIISVASISICKSNLLRGKNFRKIRNASIGRDLSTDPSQFFRFNSKILILTKILILLLQRWHALIDELIQISKAFRSRFNPVAKHDVNSRVHCVIAFAYCRAIDANDIDYRPR